MKAFVRAGDVFTEPKKSAWEAIKRAIFVQFLSHVLWCNFCRNQVTVLKSPL